MKKLTVKNITRNSIVAALYVAMTLLLAPISYGQIQCRVSEVLILLAFFNPAFIPGLTAGCLIANTFGSSLGLPDIVFGTLATFLSVFFISRCRDIKWCLIPPVVINGLVVGTQLRFVLGLPWLPSVFFVAAGEFVAVLAGVIAFSQLKKVGWFTKLVG
jgi:uncharacterized membrane protein